MEAFATKARGVHANKAVVVSLSGFQSGAIEVGQNQDVVLLMVTERYEAPPLPTDAERVVAANFYDVAISFREGENIQFPDGPKLQYLTSHTHIVEPGGEKKSVLEILNAWVQRRGLDGDEEQDYLIDFPADCTFEDEEGSRHPGACGLAFQARYIDAFLSKSTPPLDYQLQQTLAKKWVMTRLDGSPVFESFFTDLSLGLWTEVEVGKYYSIPVLHSFYRCEDISEDIVTWVLVESYQHGQLVQARFTQKTDFNDKYVPVTNKAKLIELDKLYRRLQRNERAEKRKSRTAGRN